MEKDLLLIDDDFDLSEITYDYLTDYGYSVEIAHSIKQANRAMENMTFKLIILDINLPDGLGFDFCKAIRTESNIPIIFISARTSHTDRITGLDIGGDDYMPKPYSLDELQSRIRANMRRWYSMARNQEQDYFEQDELKVDFKGRKAYVAGTLKVMTVKEFDILVYLIKNKGKVITKEMLYNKIWGEDSIGEISTISVHIRWLREKIEINPSTPQLIKTVWGKGYIFE